MFLILSFCFCFCFCFCFGLKTTNGFPRAGGFIAAALPGRQGWRRQGPWTGPAGRHIAAARRAVGQNQGLGQHRVPKDPQMNIWGKNRKIHMHFKTTHCASCHGRGSTKRKNRSERNEMKGKEKPSFLHSSQYSSSPSSFLPLFLPN